jgi:hypothetical protein
VAVRIQAAAGHRLNAIYRYTGDHWGTEQADRYITHLFEAFGKIETAEFGVEGYFFDTSGISPIGESHRTARSGS